MSGPTPTPAELAEWRAAGDLRTCRDCGDPCHVDDGGVAADPDVPGSSWLCDTCMAGYEPCDHCMRACDPADLDDDGHCTDCAADLASDRDHERATRAWLTRVS